MRSAFFIRIFTTFSAIVLALFLLAFYLTTRAVRTHYLATVERGLVSVNAIVCHAALPLLTNATHAPLQPYIRQVGALSQKRISIIAPDGTVLADSQADPARMDNHAARPEVVQALHGRRGTAQRVSETRHEPLLYLAVPLYDRGRLLAVVRVSTSVGAFETSLTDLRGRLALIALVMVALALPAMYLVWRRWAQPIELLARAARAVAAGDLTTKVYIDARDETATLGLCFNEMVARLKQNHEALAHQKDDLNTILANLSEGLLVLQHDGVVTLCNASFATLTGVSVTRGAPYWESIRAPGLMEQIERVLADRQHSQRTIELHGRHLLCNADCATGSGQAVITLHDISNILAMARMKREFVTNVSHELRTPLASIKGFAETLHETVRADERHYVEIIQRNTERLINIVTDLLHLSQLERDGFTLDCDQIVLNELIDHVAQTFMKRAADKGLQLVLDLPPTPVTLAADAFRLEQVLVNLLDNAIKYTDQGQVRIAARADEHHVIITIADTGVGIPAKDLPRIFERFYVVDKSRARAMGGTGLGLAIAKHIVQLHHGTLDVTSRPGQGTTFTIALPGHTTPAA